MAMKLQKMDVSASLPVAARPTLSLHLSSVLQDASDAVVQVGNWLEGENVDSERIADITLVLAESLNNVIEHAYSYQESGLIEIKARIRGVTMSLQIVDGGLPFVGPPDEVSVSSPNETLDELPEGGFGWFLIQKLTEDIHFSHSRGKNRLTLVLLLT
jgi:serine/threonine-protein kinase RsbW